MRSINLALCAFAVFHGLVICLPQASMFTKWSTSEKSLQATDNNHGINVLAHGPAQPTALTSQPQVSTPQALSSTDPRTWLSLLVLWLLLSQKPRNTVTSPKPIAQPVSTPVAAQPQVPVPVVPLSPAATTPLTPTRPTITIILPTEWLPTVIDDGPLPTQALGGVWEVAGESFMRTATKWRIQ